MTVVTNIRRCSLCVTLGYSYIINYSFGLVQLESLICQPLIDVIITNGYNSYSRHLYSDKANNNLVWLHTLYMRQVLSIIQYLQLMIVLIMRIHFNEFLSCVHTMKVMLIGSKLICIVCIHRECALTAIHIECVSCQSTSF